MFFLRMKFFENELFLLGVVPFSENYFAALVLYLSVKAWIFFEKGYSLKYTGSIKFRLIEFKNNL